MWKRACLIHEASLICKVMVHHSQMLSLIRWSRWPCRACRELRDEGAQTLGELRAPPCRHLRQTQRRQPVVGGNQTRQPDLRERRQRSAQQGGGAVAGEEPLKHVGGRGACDSAAGLVDSASVSAQRAGSTRAECALRPRGRRRRVDGSSCRRQSQRARPCERRVWST